MDCWVQAGVTRKQLDEHLRVGARCFCFSEQACCAPIPVESKPSLSQVAANPGQLGSWAQAPPAHKQLQLPAVGE